MQARTLKNLEDAREQLQRAREQFDRDSSSNPKARPTEINDARAEVREIERELEQSGIIRRTAQELRELELDSAFPDVAGSDVVTHKGIHYKRKSFVVRKNRRGKVQEWGRTWEEVPSPG